ncbi:divergent PAP2 family protein [Bacillus alkalisoli]|uniref:divergent PAP2 family protein n=1 Tax=Bacillus alkalisoli TaxID=2011008 RepID=UPI000C24199C|nr:divergent PAP2 family protein [Bacillus alkalisoli]
MNKAIQVALAAISIAQFLKIPITFIRTGKWNWGLLFETGGMPSSHSAGVSSLATFVALKKGIPTVDFALSTIFGLIVMYDAQGVRRQTGDLTIAVNELSEEVERLENKPDLHYHDNIERRVKEKLGHQPEEVVAGALFGIAVGVLGYIFSGGKRKKFRLTNLIDH